MPRQVLHPAHFISIPARLGVGFVVESIMNPAPEFEPNCIMSLRCECLE